MEKVIKLSQFDVYDLCFPCLVSHDIPPEFVLLLSPTIFTTAKMRFFPSRHPSPYSSSHPSINKSASFWSFRHCGIDACRLRLLDYFQPFPPSFLPFPLFFSGWLLLLRGSLHCCLLLRAAEGRVCWFSPPCQRCFWSSFSC